jgi:hypothetical protein
MWEPETGDAQENKEPLDIWCGPMHIARLLLFTNE